MDKTMVVSTQIDIAVDAAQVRRYLGYKADVEPSPRIASLLDEYIDRAGHLLQPAYSCMIRDVEAVDGSYAFVQGPVLFQGDSIARLLRRCEKVAVFVLTIGDALEEMVGRLADDGLIVEAYILDAVGSSAAEKLADFVQATVSSTARIEGLCTSHRFSPGHCDWDIGQQRMVFHALKGDWAGVYLTEDCLMVPQKSVSGIIGIGPRGDGVETFSPCETCNKRNCLARR
jgi:hypothetical protein